MKLDIKSWKEVEFGDVVSNNTKSVKDPLKNSIKYALGLENFEPENLNPVSWIDIEKDGTKFSRYFEKGQLLFGARRSYLKQMIIAPFNGVCTANIMVFDTKNSSRISREYIALVFQSNKFIDFASGTSVGSLFPNAKWNSLSKFKFKLPVPEIQKEIVQLFSILQDQIDQTKEQEKNLLQTKRQLLNELFSEKGEFGDYLTSDNYKTVSFGELAQNMSKRVEPSQTDLKVYVGLEHLDPDNLRIERQGIPDDVKGVKLLIWEGDIIFGKRRAYQRKVAVSHFDGICSAHSMVLRANEKAVKKEFLPFFMQSDVFMDRAIQISEGSLSPTIKWKVLEKQEFSIPKVDFQEKLTDLFKQFDKLIYQLREQNQTLKKLKNQLLDEILG